MQRIQQTPLNVMMQALKKHWVDYLIEAAGLGAFLVAAGTFATLLSSPASPVANLLPNGFLRGMLMGIAMGLIAIACPVGDSIELSCQLPFIAANQTVASVAAWLQLHE